MHQRSKNRPETQEAKLPLPLRAAIMLGAGVLAWLALGGAILLILRL